MKQIWSADELGEHWTISADEFALRKGRTFVGRLAVAIQLKCYQSFAAFPQVTSELSPDVIEYISDQVEVAANGLIDYGWNDRTSRQHRQEILRFLGFRVFDTDAEMTLRMWLVDKVLPAAPNASALAEFVTEWLLLNQVERTNSYQIDRIVASAGREHEERLFAAINGHPDTYGRLGSDRAAIR